MKLFWRDLGGRGRKDPETEDSAISGPETGPVLIVLHGLYGSSRNWSTAGARLADPYRVVAPDLRNHGDSAHHAEMSYAAMAEDVVDLLDELALDSAVVMGHSLGGKVAMRLACTFPRRVSHLLVLDIAPKEGAPDRRLLDDLLAADLAVQRRAEVEEQLREAIPDQATRWFLMTNLERVEGGFAWRPNLEAIREAYDEIVKSPLAHDDRYHGPTDVIGGGRSDYVTPSDRPLIERHFPKARLHVLESSGHNVHIEGGDEFVELVRECLQRARSVSE